MSINAAENGSFIFDCTPSGGNPAVYSYTFRKGSVVVTEGVSGSVLIINPVVRGSRGVYTCEANNTVGMAVISQTLFVNGEQYSQFSYSQLSYSQFSYSQFSYSQFSYSQFSYSQFSTASS